MAPRGLVKDFGLGPRGSRQHLKGFSGAVASSDGLYRRMSMAGGGDESDDSGASGIRQKWMGLGDAWCMVKMA